MQLKTNRILFNHPIPSDLVYQGSFGVVGKPTEGITTLFVKKASSIILNIFLPMNKKYPYTVGSKWTISVDKNGEIHVIQLGRTEQ
jgi:hypothetical protein